MPLKITLTISGMGCGGAEHVMAQLGAHLAGAGHSVTLLAVRPDPVFYPVDRRIDFRISNIPTPDRAGLPSRILNFARKVMWLRAMFRKDAPDIIISFTEVANCMSLAAAAGMKTPVIVSERVNPEHHPVPSIYKILRRRLYPRAAAVALQTQDLAKWAAGWLQNDRVKFIPNPVETPPAEGARAEDFLADGKKTIAAMGRFVRQKGFDMLLEAYAEAKTEGWRLLLIGDGEARGDLEFLAASLGVADSVGMPGIVRNPAPALRGCEFFVMSSRYEGFPNALCEAMACGLPAVSFNCPSGPSEIIRDGVDGLLVENGNVEALAGAMKKMIGDEEMRKRMSARATEILERFSPERIMGMWDALIEETAGAGDARR